MKQRLFATVCGIVLALLCGFAGVARAEPRTASLPPSVRRVLFLGDSITYAGQYAAYVETYFATRYPERRIEFINVGLPSETTSGLSEPGHAGGQFPRPVLSERLARVLEQTKPDLVFACYGMNDGIYLPFDAGRFQAFQNGIQSLHDAVLAAHAQIIHVTPPYYDGQITKNPAYMDTLDHYAKWLLDQRRRQKWQVIDVHGPMTDFIDARRKTDPGFAYAPRDGVHPGDLGHWVIARAILKGLGAQDIDGAGDAQQMAAAYPHGAEILTLVRQREDLMKDAWLTATGHKRPGMKTGMPLPDAQAKAAEMETQIRTLLGEEPMTAPTR